MLTGPGVRPEEAPLLAAAGRCSSLGVRAGPRGAAAGRWAVLRSWWGGWVGPSLFCERAVPLCKWQHEHSTVCRPSPCPPSSPSILQAFAEILCRPAPSGITPGKSPGLSQRRPRAVPRLGSLPDVSWQHLVSRRDVQRPGRAGPGQSSQMRRFEASPAHRRACAPAHQCAASRRGIAGAPHRPSCSSPPSVPPPSLPRSPWRAARPLAPAWEPPWCWRWPWRWR